MNYVNSIIVISALAVGSGTFGADVLPNNCVEKQVLNFCTKWRNGDIHPALENMKITSVDSTYEGYGIKIKYTTGDMQLAGARNFTVKDLSVSPNEFAASMTFIFPLLTLTAEQYNLSGRAYLMYSLKGSGLMTIDFQNVEITLGISLVSNGAAADVDDIHLNFNVDNIKVNLADSSWPLNKVLNSKATDILESYRTTIKQAAKNKLKQLLNEYLAAMTSSQLLSIINNDYCANPLPAVPLPFVTVAS